MADLGAAIGDASLNFVPPPTGELTCRKSKRLPERKLWRICLWQVCYLPNPKPLKNFQRRIKMNLAGIMPRNSYAVDVLRQGRRMTDVKDGTRMVQFLKELCGILQQKGYSIEGSVREGFECFNGDETITISVERL